MRRREGPPLALKFKVACHASPSCFMLVLELEVLKYVPLE